MPHARRPADSGSHRARYTGSHRARPAENRPAASRFAEDRSAARPRRRWVSAAVLAGVTLVAGFFAVPNAQAASTVKAMSFNVCGAVCRGGEITTTAAFAANKATSTGASVAFLQELCYSQYKRIQKLVAKKGYSTVYTSTTNSRTCDNHDKRYGTGFGMAILVKGRVSGRTVLRLPVTPGHEGRAVLGATARIGGRSTFVAVVHNSPSAAGGLDRQLKVLASFLNAKAARPTIVGGDFNAMPGNPGMGRFYSPAAGGTGRFTELDETRRGKPARSGMATFRGGNRKIDYIFVSRAHFGSPKATSRATSVSDHCVYIGAARLR
jgi:endonuclease/exonuclease/phosphatase family metal-dependent hydrolase